MCKGVPKPGDDENLAGQVSFDAIEASAEERDVTCLIGMVCSSKTKENKSDDNK